MLQDQNPSSPILSLPTSSAADRNSFADRKTPIKTPLNIRRPLRPNNSTPLPYPSTPRNNPASNQVSSQMFNSSLNANALAPKPTLVIWGTAVNVEDTKNAFLHFLNDFELSYKTENLSTDKFYVKLFQDVLLINLVVQCKLFRR